MFFTLFILFYFKECLDPPTHTPPCASEPAQNEPSGSFSNTVKFLQLLPPRMLSVRVTDCRHKLGAEGVFIVHEECDQGDHEICQEGADSNYAPDGKSVVR